MHEVTRRDFLKVGAASAAVGITSLGFDVAAAVQVKQSFRIEGAKEAPLPLPLLRGRLLDPRLHQAGRQRERPSSCRSRATRTAR